MTGPHRVLPQSSEKQGQAWEKPVRQCVELFNRPVRGALIDDITVTTASLQRLDIIVCFVSCRESA